MWSKEHKHKTLLMIHSNTQHVNSCLFSVFAGDLQAIQFPYMQTS